jgi:hypothetical protein
MRVAFNRIKITPKEYIGKAMAGYSRPDPCLGKLDDVYAYGVLIEDIVLGNIKKRLLLISLDLLKVPLVVSDYIKEKIQEEFLSLGPGQILIHATHTHSAPDITGEFYWPGGILNVVKGIMFGANRNDRYIVWMTKQIVKMVSELFNDLKPCKIAWTKEKFNPDIVINRRHPTKKPTPDLGVITFKGLKDNKLIGFIINYACHPTSLSFANNKLSADYPGRVIHRINELTDNKIKAAYFNGPAGDLNPITTCGTYYEYLDVNRKLIYNQMGNFEHTTKIGYIIAEEALKLAKSIPDNQYFENLEFTSYLKTIWIPMKDAKYFSPNWFQNKLVFLLKKYLILPVAMAHEEDPNFPGLAIKHRGQKINGYTLLHILKIKAYSKNSSKELTILTVPGELFEKIGDFLKKKSPTGENNTFIFQNSHDWIAYLFPLKEYIKQGGYEPMASFAPLCGYYVTKEMLNLFDEINSNILFSHS